MLDYQCVTEGLWRRPACRDSSHSDAASLENGVRKRHFLHRLKNLNKRGKIRPFFTPFCSLFGYGMITYTSNNPLIRVIPNQ